MAQTTNLITVEPAALAAEIASLIESAKPRPQAVHAVRDALLDRKVQLGLVRGAAAEYVAETLFRCLVIDHLQGRFRLAPRELPRCINSSHRAGRRVCGVPSSHCHNLVSDADWAEGWRRLKEEHPKVNVNDPSRPSAGRADLYVITRNAVVSVEFKYSGRTGLSDIRGCATQMRRYAQQHAATLLAIYDGASNGTALQAANQLRGLLGPAVPVVVVSGPSIPPK